MMAKVGDYIISSCGFKGILVYIRGHADGYYDYIMYRSDGRGWSADARPDLKQFIPAQYWNSLYWIGPSFIVVNDINYVVKKFLLEDDKDSLVHYLKMNPEAETGLSQFV
jgi:hypothetical protein